MYIFFYVINKHLSFMQISIIFCILNYFKKIKAFEYLPVELNI